MKLFGHNIWLHLTSSFYLLTSTHNPSRFTNQTRPSPSTHLEPIQNRDPTYTSKPNTMPSQRPTYKSPLEGYENAPPLPTEKAEDGKSLLNIQTGVLSSAYDKFPEPLDNGRRGAFDVHIYHLPNHPAQAQYAASLHERIRREFPELRIYTFWSKPVGPHPIAMFEVNIFTPAQFGAFVGWLAVWRGPLSVLIHPNTTEPTIEEGGEMSEAEKEARNHTDRAIWMGEKVVLNTDLFYEVMDH